MQTADKIKLFSAISRYGFGVCGVAFYFLKLPIWSFAVLCLVFTAISVYVSILYRSMPIEQRRGIFSYSKRHPYYVSVCYAVLTIVLLIVWIYSLLR